MLEIRPNCELCDADLPPNSLEACICSYECTFCKNCVATVLKNVCPNCGGGFSPRPIRPVKSHRPGVGLEYQLPSTRRVTAKYSRDEMIEFSIASNKVAGLRNMMEEVGMPEDDPTVIYQDNEATIQIAMNRGSLSNRSKHIDLKVLQSRNKIEDGIVKPVFEKSGLMFADLGTKACQMGSLNSCEIK